MFTGIVEGTGTVVASRAKAGGTRRLVIAASFGLGRLPTGASIAVDGACLTVVSRTGRRFAADLGPETLAATTLGALRPGDRVHLERPLRVGDPLGGHLVSGHVDATGVVRAATRRGDALGLTVEVPASIAPYLAPKGSITIAGVSLTINAVTGRRFSVMLIPHTLAVTTLGERRAGDRVNIEADLIAKQIARLLTTRRTRNVS